MATQRYISTSFWDDEWVQNQSRDDRYFYLYLLTNPLTNIAGVYQITDRRIAFDTGFEKNEVLEKWKFFETEQKAYRRGEWVIIPSWPKHQKWQTKDTIRVGIDKILVALPQDILIALKEVSYLYPIGTIPIRHPQDPTYLDSDSDTDIELGSESVPKTDSDLNEIAGEEEWPTDEDPFKTVKANMRKGAVQ